MKTTSFKLLALFCLLFINCAKDNDNPIDPAVTELTDKLTTIANTASLPGFSVTVIKNNEIAFQKSFGLANVSQQKKYTNQTTQPIGSVSKTFIGVALMKAIEQGHFTLSTEINDILPFPIVNPHNPNIPILIKHLVTHTSSFEDSDVAYDLNYYILEGEDIVTPAAKLLLSFGIQVGTGMSLKNYIKACYSPDGVFYDVDNFNEAAPGTNYEYSNITASLAAYLIEIKTGQSYASFVKEFIFNPLNMNNSAFEIGLVDQNKAATLYLSKNHPLPRYSSPSYPDGFLNTSSEELGFYLLEMIKGHTGNGTILSKESFQTLFTLQSAQGVPISESHGVFWGIGNGRIEHDGSDAGVDAQLSFDSTTSKGYLILTNIDTDYGDDLDIDTNLIENDLRKVLNLVRDFEKKN